jgi:hypothetical protein
MMLHGISLLTFVIGVYLETSDRVMESNGSNERESLFQLSPRIVSMLHLV